MQTSNIDGETNLKERDALDYTQKLFSDKKFKKTHDNLNNFFKYIFFIKHNIIKYKNIFDKINLVSFITFFNSRCNRISIRWHRGN